MTSNSKKERRKDRKKKEGRKEMSPSTLSIGHTNSYVSAYYYLFTAGGKELTGSVGLHDDRVSFLVIFLENIICRLDGVLGKNVDPISKAQGVLHRRDRTCTTTGTQLIRAKKRHKFC